MNKPHVLGKLPSAMLGTLTFGVSILTASSVNASSFPVGECFRFNPFAETPDPNTMIIFQGICEDKEFTFYEPDLISQGGADFNPAFPEIIVGVVGDGTQFQVQLDANQSITPQTGNFEAEIIYDIEIIQAFVDQGYRFNEVDLDSTTVDGIPDEIVTKEIFSEAKGTGNLLNTLVSVDGDGTGFEPINTMPTFVSVVDTAFVPQNGTLDDFQNTFTQKRAPEASTLLGLLSIATLGLGLKRKN